jgi:hypothetical protein
MMSCKRDSTGRRVTAVTLCVLMLQAALAPAVALAAASPGVPPGGSGPNQQEQQDRMLIGVLPLDANNVDAGEASAIADRLRLYLGRVEVNGQRMFQVIERQQMETIMEELGFQLSGACDTDECVVQVGKILGARKMVAGSVSKVGNLYSLQVRIVDIESSRIEDSAFSDRNGIELVLTEATQDVANQLAASVAGQVEQEPVQQPVVQQPPVQEQQPAVEEQGEQTPTGEVKRSKWWLWALLVGGVGGGAAIALGGGGGGDTGGGPDIISTPPSRPVPPL